MATLRRTGDLLPRVMDPDTPLNGAVRFAGQLSPALLSYWLQSPSARMVK